MLYWTETKMKLKWHFIEQTLHTKLHPNSSSSSRDEACRWTDINLPLSFCALYENNAWKLQNREQRNHIRTKKNIITVVKKKSPVLADFADLFASILHCYLLESNNPSELLTVSGKCQDSLHCPTRIVIDFFHSMDDFCQKSRFMQNHKFTCSFI